MIQIKREHLNVPQYNGSEDWFASNGIWIHLFKSDGDKLVIERLLPKGLEWNDFSPSENLIEIEERDGNRYWVPTTELFRIPCPSNTSLRLEINKTFNVRMYEQIGGYLEAGMYQVFSVFQVKLIEFRPRIFRKRNYVQAVFTKFPDSIRHIYRTKQKQA